MVLTPRARWLIALIFVAVLHGFFLRQWSLKDTRPLAWDQATHTKIAYLYKDRFAADGFNHLFRPVDFNYPPLFHLALIPALSVVKDPTNAGALVNFLYLLALMLAVFFIGEALMGAWEGGTAALLVSCYPILFGLMRESLIDFSLTAWVAICFLFLLKSDNLTRPLWSGLFGLSVGLSVLTKWTTPLYLTGPLIPVLWNVLRTRNFKGPLLAIGVAVVAASPWYITNFIPMMVRLPQLAALPPAGGESHGLGKLFWYVVALKAQMGVPLLLLFLPGLAVCFWRPKLTSVFLWFVFSLLLFSFLTNKNLRYTAPALPAAALLTVAWLPPARRIPFFAVAVVALWALSISVRTFHAYPDNWQHQAVIEKVLELKPSDDPLARVVVVSNSAHFHSTTLNVSVRSQKTGGILFDGVGKRRWFEFGDFILLKTGDIGPFAGNVQECANFIAQPPAWFKRVFKEVGRWPLPDQSEAVLFQCKPDPEQIPDVGIFNISLDQLEMPNIRATGVEVQAEPLSAAATRVGRLKSLRIRCATVEYKTIRFEKVDIKLIDPQVNLALFLTTGELQLNSLKTLAPRGEVSADMLLAYAAKKAKWLKDPSVVFDGSFVKIAGSAGGIPIQLAAEVKVSGNELESRMLSMKVMHIPLPLIFFRNLTDRTVKLSANPNQPYDLDLGQIQGDGQRLRIGL